ncbi:J domain-containing protein [Bradyrhizobium sp. Leo121]|uniref:J domain-containing protein n=1 Tax=Bradyrhizobium sp. Leo121 TaxID=1571195 RepID=UPI0010291B1C|nr:J domain-containing protein [Bradyrhizobium sp. Leo121]RZN30468.1 J domain-containing protein [Bradyrhizobium sp. Leo121]
MDKGQVQAYPLQWPEGFPRTKVREKSRFSTTLAKALGNVETSLRLFGKESGKKIENIVLSSNVTLGAQRPADPGICCWFVWDNTSIAIPVDRYQTVEANLQAAHHILEARRTELRHGTLALVRATFAGFKALPSPKGKHWREVLGIEPASDVNREMIEQIFKQLAKRHHPDAGGSTEAWHELNKARLNALQEITE